MPLPSAHLSPDCSQTALHGLWPCPWQPHWCKLLHSMEGDIAPPQKSEQTSSVLAHPSGEALHHVRNLLHLLPREEKSSPSSENNPNSVALLKLRGRALQHFSGTKCPCHPWL